MPRRTGSNRRAATVQHYLQVARFYEAAIDHVRESGYSEEIEWQRSRLASAVTESEFLRQAAWVVLSSGMSERAIHAVFPRVEDAFEHWTSPSRIVEARASFRRRAVRAFGHKAKIDALLRIVESLHMVGVKTTMDRLRRNGPSSLRILPYMGPATSMHLAKNLGIPVSKPDRHLTRMAAAAGYASVASFCAAISGMVGEAPSVVDLVLWRFATLERRYLRLLGRVVDPLPA